jgi:hypothetical protein
MSATQNYSELIAKLDAFIRKYYINQLLKGLLLTVSLMGAVFLVFSLSENFFYFGKSGRKVLFYSFLGLSLFTLVRWVALPLLQYFKLGKVISHDKAAHIIGDHFTEVKDKLLNILQLHRQWTNQPNAALLLASIEQKTESLKPVSFPSAIDLTKNRRYLRFAIPPLAIVTLLLFAAPGLIKEPASRILANDQEFERPAPFKFVLAEAQPEVVQYGQYKLEIHTEGKVVPNEVFISIGEFQYQLKKEATNQFSYTFTNVSKPVDFQLFSGEVTSTTFTLGVLAKPAVAHFDVTLDYPAYTGRVNEKLSNTGDLVVPVGTRITWAFRTEHTDTLTMKFGELDLEEPIKRQGKSDFIHSRRAARDEAYQIVISNINIYRADSLRYFLSTIPDLHPSITVEPFVDSLDQSFVYFAGDAQDDYGLSQLTFNYRISRENGAEEPVVAKTMPIKKGKDIHFDHGFNIRDIGLNPGDEVTYYFEVWDNDAVNGRKSSRSQVMRFAKPTVEAYAALEKMNNEEIIDKLQDAFKESKALQKEMEKLTNKLLQEKSLDWQQRKELEKLLEKRQNLQKEVEQAKDLFQQNLKNQQEFSQPKEEILKKQEQVEKLFEEMLSEEMKEMLKEMEKMLQEMEKDEALEKMEEMKLDEEELSKELDRMMEMFKQLEVEKDAKEQIEKLEELAKEQENLAEKTENKEQSQEDLKKEQEELNEKFDELQKDMKELMEKNEELESPLQLGDPEEKMDEIDQDMEDSKDELGKDQNSKASKSQKEAAKKMKDMAKAMEMGMDAGEEEQAEEDMAALRQLLENLLALSFEQEALSAEVNVTSEAAPRYVTLVQVQKKLQDDFKMVEDSLHALSKRVIQIESFVTEKVTEVKGNMKRSVNDLEERKKAQATVDQQFAMKNLNDLALMLDEAMQQMQQEMAGKKSGNQNCKKPGGKSSGGGKPKDKMSQGQKSLNEMMKDLQDRMKSGGKTGSSKEFAQMAAKQAAMRKALEELAKEKSQSGKPDPQLQDLLDQMDRSEIDLVNKRLTSETMKRQEEILKRLLDHEKAEREREFEEKRKAEVATQYERKMPPGLEEYLRKRQSELDLYRTVSPELKPYYKNLVEEYHRNLKNIR